MPRGGARPGAGRPLKSATARTSVTWRLPIHLLTNVYRRAEAEGVPVTTWVEQALEQMLRVKPVGAR